VTAPWRPRDKRSGSCARVAVVRLDAVEVKDIEPIGQIEQLAEDGVHCRQPFIVDREPHRGAHGAHGLGGKGWPRISLPLHRTFLLRMSIVSVRFMQSDTGVMLHFVQHPGSMARFVPLSRDSSPAGSE
jgi:hypothetical protein